MSRVNRGSIRRSQDQQSQHAARGLVDDSAADNAAPYESSRSSKSSNSDSRHSYLQPQQQQQQQQAAPRSPSSVQSAPYLALASPSVYTRDPELVQQTARAAAMQKRRPLAAPLLSDGESAHLLSPSTNAEYAQERLSALLYPEDRYSSSKQHVRSFYDTQNEFVSSLKRLVTLQASEEENEKPSTAAYLAIQISLGLTFILLGLKLFTAIYSGSIAVVASAVDSGLDVLSQGTLLFTTRLMKKYDPYNYPAGKNRMEPVAVLLFSIIMGMAALFLLYESVTDLLDGLSAGGKHVKMDAVTVSILAAVVAVQFVMWLYCKRVAALPIPGASAADALAQDHINDVFINLIGGVPAIIAGYVSGAWIADPVGGMCLSVYIAVRWTLSALEQIPMLVGKTADPSFLNQLTYLAGTHDERILKVDTILAYHMGAKYQCEVHIVVPEDMSLKEAHDIGESLETKIERLDCVEMAFVHLDYEFDHKPEHAARAIAAGRETVAKKPTAEEVELKEPDAAAAAAAQPDAVQPAAGDKAANHSATHLIDMLPAASMPATVSLASNPTHAPITAERAIPSATTAATGH